MIGDTDLLFAAYALLVIALFCMFVQVAALLRWVYTRLRRPRPVKRNYSADYIRHL